MTSLSRVRQIVTPECNISWWRDGEAVSGSNVLRLEAIQLQDEGNYTCVAWYSPTGFEMSNDVEILVYCE